MDLQYQQDVDIGCSAFFWCYAFMGIGCFASSWFSRILTLYTTCVTLPLRLWLLAHLISFSFSVFPFRNAQKAWYHGLCVRGVAWSLEGCCAWEILTWASRDRALQWDCGYWECCLGSSVAPVIGPAGRVASLQVSCRALRLPQAGGSPALVRHTELPAFIRKC